MIIRQPVRAANKVMSYLCNVEESIAVVIILICVLIRRKTYHNNIGSRLHWKFVIAA